MFHLMIHVAFFGMGNVASLASFRLESVYRFMTVFSPFIMAALLIVKILVPFVMVSVAFGAVSSLLNVPPFSLFLLVVCTADIMTLNFFFMVRDEGSWLEIGTSISHFVIASAFGIFTIVLFVLSKVFVSTSGKEKMQ
jgi:phosphatidylinositol glycan class N